MDTMPYFCNGLQRAIMQRLTIWSGGVTDTTNTNPRGCPMGPTLDEMLAGVEAALRAPDPIGTLHGEVVYLNHLGRTLSFGGMTVALDHPYLTGTAIRDVAMKRLGET